MWKVRLIIYKMVMNSQLLYLVYFYLSKKKRNSNHLIHFPKFTCDYYIGGFERSGNTHLTQIFNNFIQNKPFVSHLHAPIVFRMSVKKGVKTFITVRSPQECISSYYLKSSRIPFEGIDDEKLSFIIEKYIFYHRLLLKCIDDIQIIKFEKALEYNKEYFQKLFNPFKVVLDEDFKNVCINLAKTRIGIKQGLGASRPSQEKEQLKDLVKLKLESSERFEKAEELYNEIITKSNQI